MRQSIAKLRTCREKRIVRAFMAYGCRRSMSTVQRIIIGQGKKLFANAAQQFFMVATGQIGSAYAALKQGIAANYRFAVVVYEYHVSGCMPGHVTHFQ